MHRVVAMVDVGPALLAELDLEPDAPIPAQPPDILPDQVLCRRNRVSAPVHGDAFLEVQMDGVVPAVTLVDVGPVLDLSGFRDQQRYPVGVEGVRVLPVHLDGPGEGRVLRAIRRAWTGCVVPRVA